MRRFRFRLESVLEVRRFSERAAAEELGRAHRALHLTRQAVERAQAEGRKALALRDGTGTTEGLRLTIVEAQRLVVETRENLAQARLEHERQEQRTTEAHAAWMRCRERVQGLERIRERQGTAHLRDQMALEGRQLDEIALFRSVNAPTAFQNL
jgi:flagellar export protein FliJ